MSNQPKSTLSKNRIEFNIKINTEDFVLQYQYSNSTLTKQFLKIKTQYSRLSFGLSISRFKFKIHKLHIKIGTQFQHLQVCLAIFNTKIKITHTSNSTSISRILSISTSISTNINQSCPPLPRNILKTKTLPNNSCKCHKNDPSVPIPRLKQSSVRDWCRRVLLPRYYCFLSTTSSYPSLNYGNMICWENVQQGSYRHRCGVS